MNRRELLALGLAFFATVGLVQAADKNDPTGTWKWTITFNDQKRDQTLNLKLADGKLTGAMLGRDNQEIKIEDGMFKDGEVTFTVTRERNGQKFVSKYKGKVDGDSIKGTFTFNRDGTDMTRDWDAKRS